MRFGFLLAQSITRRLSSFNGTYQRLQLCQFKLFASTASMANMNHCQPWLLSNIIDTVTMKIPFALKEFEVLERSGIRVGVIGLVEKYVLVPSFRIT